MGKENREYWRDIFYKREIKESNIAGAQGGRGKAKGRESGNGGGKNGRRLSPLVCPFKGRKKKTGENPPRLLVCVVFDPVFVIVDKCFVFELPRGDKLVPNAFIILFSLQMAHERINAQF